MTEILQVKIEHAGYANNKEVVRDIRFALRKGQMTGLIGPNGAGKSTVIKAVLGLLPEVAGIVKTCGEDVRYAYIPEQPALYDELTLWEHLELAAAAYGMKKKGFLNESEKLLALFRLQKERHHLPGGFSKGMQQKVMLIIAFLAKADVYIVDEPFMGLDPRAIKDFLNLLDNEKKRGAGVLMSTHALDIAERVCDSFVLMTDGKVAGRGDLEQIRRACRLPGSSLFDCLHKILESTT